MIKKYVAVLFFLSSSLVLAVPTLEAYGRLPAVELMRLSPSGNRFAFVAVVGEARRLAIVSDKGAVVFATNIGEAKVRNLKWVGENRVLVWVSSTYKDPLMLKQAYEFSSVANINLKTNKLSFIFADKRKIANIVFGYAGAAQINGRDYGYFTGITYGGSSANEYGFVGDHRDLYQVDLETNETQLFARGGDGPTFQWLVDTDGSVLAHSVYEVNTGTWRLYAGENDKKLVFEKISPFRDIEIIGRGRSANTIWISDSTSNANVTEEISLVNGQRETLFAEATPSDYLSDPDNGMAIGASLLEDPYVLFFDERLQARMKGTRKAFPNSHVTLVSYGRNLDRLIVKTDGQDDSGTYWLVDIASGKADPIGFPYPEIRPKDVGSTQMFSYKASDGLEIKAVLTLPPNYKSGKLPLVVLPHGGPIGVSDGVSFDWWAQAYASVGYAVLQPNFRGSGGRGAEFEAAGYGQWGRKMQSDLSDGVAALASRDLIDAKRVCIVGASYGGYAALAGITLQHDIYRCAVSVSGPADLPTFFVWQRDKHGGRENDATRYWRAVTGADKEGDSVMKKISPTYFAEQASAPILLIHGKDDTIVPIEQSRLMESALRRAKKSVEFMEMPGEDHWLSREETRKTMLQASVAFVLTHNPPD